MRRSAYARSRSGQNLMIRFAVHLFIGAVVLASGCATQPVSRALEEHTPTASGSRTASSTPASPGRDPALGHASTEAQRPRMPTTPGGDDRQALAAETRSKDLQARVH